MEKTAGTIIGLIFTAMLMLCGCASGDGGNKGERSSSAGGLASVMEMFGKHLWMPRCVLLLKYLLILCYGFSQTKVYLLE